MGRRSGRANGSIVKPQVTLLVVVLLSLAIAACGGAAKTSSSSSSKTAASADTQTIHRPGITDAEDGDDTPGETNNSENNDDREIEDRGEAANASDKQSMTEFTKRYITAAGAEDGATACSLMVTSLAKSLPSTYGAGRGPLHGKTCAEVMTKVFKQQHRLLAAEAAGLEVTGVRVSGKDAFALLAFTTFPERRYIATEREGGVWKITEELVDGPYP